MAFKIVDTVLSAAVASAGTITLAYPTGTAQADFTGDNAAADGKTVVGNNHVFNEADGDIAIAYGATNITLTNNSGETWPSGARLLVQLGQVGGEVVHSLRQQPAPSDASTAHALSATFTDTEVEAALNALGAKINLLTSRLKAAGILS